MKELTDEEKRNLVGLFDVLFKVHRRLVKEGKILVDEKGRIIEIKNVKP